MTNININDLTVRQVRDLATILNISFNGTATTSKRNSQVYGDAQVSDDTCVSGEAEQNSEAVPFTTSPISSFFIGKKAIIRTYSAGVWFGTVTAKEGNEVILSNARRVWRWKAVEGISLSCISVHGIAHDESRVAMSVENVWLEAIEIIPATDQAISSIEGSPNAKAR